MGEFTYINGKFQELKDLDTLVTQIRYHINKVDKINEHLREENKRIRDEKYAESELAAMKEKYDKMQADYHRGFPITEKEKKKVTEWQMNHIKTRHRGQHSSSAIGGDFQYLFTPTSIGVFGSCICGSCHSRAMEEIYNHPDMSYEAKKKIHKKYDDEFTFQEEA